MTQNIMEYPDRAWWPAPAKLNLMLRVIGRRPDGYHLLQTVFHFIDYCDQLKFEITDDGIIRRQSGNESIPESEDLIIRAAQLLQHMAGTGLGVSISIDKRIPAGG
ncbi:MAG: 4-(cytidine 5'-diphospho)-2-C-methyl-D-erythritol kinase, partial [Sedimenticola sp.]|nr:4-(cytidine 5'-diphospho)-2-C-methyl-D-erythritol kinase [Sedimenticola sp.]